MLPLVQTVAKRSLDLFGLTCSHPEERTSQTETSTSRNRTPSADRSGDAGGQQLRVANTNKASQVASAEGQRARLGERMRRVEMNATRAKGADELRLLGHYKVPNAAASISTPTDSLDDTRHITMAPKPFKPLNTLNNKSGHPAGREEAFARKPVDAANGTLRTESSIGSNVVKPWMKPFGRNDFQQDESTPISKRRKVNDTAIDLTDEVEAEVLAVNGRMLVRHVPEEPIGDELPFQLNAYSNTQQFVRPPTSRKRRKSKDQTRSSQNSDPVSMSPDLAPRLHISNTRRGPPSVDISEDEGEPYPERTSKRQKIKRSTPEIELPGEYPRMPNSSTQRHDTALSDVQPPTRRPRMEWGSPRPSQNLISLDEESAKPVSTRFGRRSAGPSSASPSSASPYSASGQRHRQTGNGRMDRSFNRDSGMSYPVPPPRAKERMMQTSARKVSPIKDVEDSDSSDELHGERTIRMAERSNTTKGERRRVSSADLQPSTLRSSARSCQKPASVQQQYTEQQSADIMPIRAFHSVSRSILSMGDLVLRFNEQAKQFQVLQNGDAVTAPAQQQPLALGSAEMQKIFFSKTGCLVCIRGASSRHIGSTGVVCVEFESHKGVEWLTDLASAMDERITLELKDETMAATIFTTQYKNMEKARLLNAERAQRAATVDKAVAAQLKGPGEDEIVYDCADEEVRQPRHSTRAIGIFQRDFDSVEYESRKKESTTSKYFSAPDRARRATRHSEPVSKRTPTPPLPERWTRAHADRTKRFNHSIVYPPTGTKRVTVDPQDLERLDEGEFLNDNVINFALRQVEENLAPQQKNIVHFFNTFFFTALTTNNGRKAFNYAAVKRWTKDKDIFTVPFVVVPININLHWFVAIICNLDNLDRTLRMDAVGSDEADILQAAALSSRAANEGASHSSDAEGHGSAEIFQFVGDRVVTDEQRPAPSRGAGKKKGKVPPPRKYAADAPIIITLDSFGSSHPAEVRSLKDYVIAEGEDKRGMNVDSKQLQGITAKGIPEQSNFCDCGVYLIGYVEQFARDPKGFVSKILAREDDELKQDFVHFEASGKRNSIRNDLLKLSDQQHHERLERKKLKKAGSKEGDAQLKHAPSSPRQTSSHHDIPSRPTRSSGLHVNEGRGDAGAGDQPLPGESLSRLQNVLETDRLVENAREGTEQLEKTAPIAHTPGSLHGNVVEDSQE